MQIYLVFGNYLGLIYCFTRYYGCQPDNISLCWKNGFGWNLFWEVLIFLFVFLMYFQWGFFNEFPSSLLKSVGVLIYSVLVLSVSVTLFTWASLHERCWCITAFVRDAIPLQTRFLVGSALCRRVSPPPLPLLRCSCDVISVGQRTASAY